MFLKATQEVNNKLIEIAMLFHQQSSILPDSYVIDVDTFLDNAKLIIDEAKSNNMEMYFMLKQIGRNPYLAKKLMDLGYHGAVVVDFKEAKVMMDNNIPISNVGHLVQTPFSMIRELIDYGCTYFTVFSLEMIKEINRQASSSGVVQKLLIKVIDDKDMIYNGQIGGFRLDELTTLIQEVKKLSNVEITGVTSFPCFLLDQNTNDVLPTENMKTIVKAIEIFEDNNLKIKEINTPSTTCVSTIKKMKTFNATSGEPGHGLTGTTPLHALSKQAEKPCVIYLSEIAYNYLDKSYCYGGGHYRRSHVKNAVVSTKQLATLVTPVNDESIDYYFELDNNFEVGQPVVMAFRFQIFVTRSDVVLIEGIKNNNPKIVGTYNSLGNKING